MTTTSSLNLDSSYYTTESTSSSSTSSADSNSVVGKDEFLQLLIVQLQNQDPLDPVENEDFAINLAQFSQLEQLISINDTLENSAGSTSSAQGLASYLGHKAILSDSSINVSGNSGGEITFNLPQDATNVYVNLVDENNNAVETVSAGAMQQGENSYTLNNLSTSAGSYTAQVQYEDSLGVLQSVDYAVSGTISGFIPGESEKPLLIGDTQISLSDIKEVRS